MVDLCLSFCLRNCLSDEDEEGGGGRGEEEKEGMRSKAQQPEVALQPLRHRFYPPRGLWKQHELPPARACVCTIPYMHLAGEHYSSLHLFTPVLITLAASLRAMVSTAPGSSASGDQLTLPILAGPHTLGQSGSGSGSHGHNQQTLGIRSCFQLPSTPAGATSS